MERWEFEQLEKLGAISDQSVKKKGDQVLAGKLTANGGLAGSRLDATGLVVPGRPGGGAGWTGILTSHGAPDDTKAVAGQWVFSDNGKIYFSSAGSTWDKSVTAV